jgi:hypothetical protein
VETVGALGRSSQYSTSLYEEDAREERMTEGPESGVQITPFVEPCCAFPTVGAAARVILGLNEWTNQRAQNPDTPQRKQQEYGVLYNSEGRTCNSIR